MMFRASPEMQGGGDDVWPSRSPRVGCACGHPLPAALHLAHSAGEHALQLNKEIISKIIFNYIFVYGIHIQQVVTIDKHGMYHRRRVRLVS